LQPISALEPVYTSAPKLPKCSGDVQGILPKLPISQSKTDGRKEVNVKRIVLVGLLILGALLTACGEPTDASLKTLSRGFPMFTDDEALLKPLNTFNELHLVETEGLQELALDYSGGLVSYTPIPDWDGWRTPEIPDFINPNCLLILCDDEGNPVPGSYDGFDHIGYDLSAVYATPALVKQASKYGLDAEALRKLDASTLVEVATKLNVNVGSVGQYLPGSPWERICNQRPVPRICWLIDAGGLSLDKVIVSELEGFKDYGLIITNLGALAQLEDVGELVQLHGEGLEPAFSALQVGFAKGVDEGAAFELLETIYSEEGQYSLGQAGIIPLSEGAFQKTFDKNLANHVKDALAARPTPIPVD